MQHIHLIKECKLNNKRAQIELYRNYNQGMYNVAMRLLRNSDDADDIIQESFLSAFKNISQFRADVTFGAWIKKIVVHKCLNYIKQKSLDVVELDETYTSNFEIEDNGDWVFDGSVV